ncbi:MAG: glycosyltransferase family 4 protein [Ignavibacteriota bacterium]
MKILQISPQISFPPDSGGRLSIYGITKSLHERGHEITFVCYIQESVNEDISNELKKICNPIFIKWETKNKITTAIHNLFSNIPYNISKYYSVKFEEFLVEYLRQNQVDIIHIDHLHMAWAIDLIKKNCNVPVILREHNLEMKIMQRYYGQQSNLFLKLYSYIQFKKFLSYEPTICKKFDCCLMVTFEDEKSLLNLNPDIKTKVIPIGVDENLFNFKDSNTLPFSLFHIGTLDWQPNFDSLLWFWNEVFPSIVAKYPNSKLFVYSKGVERLKVPKSLKDNIILKGYVKDIWEEIKDKQILIVPLRAGGGMRVKIIEMLAAGQLIVTTSIGKEGIDVVNGQHLLIANSAEEFTDRIISFFKNEYEKTMFSRNAKELIRAKYTWSKIAEEFENIYIDLIYKK